MGQDWTGEWLKEWGSEVKEKLDLRDQNEIRKKIQASYLNESLSGNAQGGWISILAALSDQGVQTFNIRIKKIHFLFHFLFLLELDKVIETFVFAGHLKLC